MSKREKAREVLERVGIAVGEDFHAVSLLKRDELEEWADWVRYRKSKNANGSRLRSFHDHLQRLAQREEE